jgi:2-methylcitrate dehydratase
MSNAVESNVRPDPDKELVDIARYVDSFDINSDDAYRTARYCLMDTLGCGFLALAFPNAPSTWARWYPARPW